MSCQRPEGGSNDVCIKCIQENKPGTSCYSPPKK